MPLWQRQPDEAPADFTAFVAYLRLKGRRSLRAVSTQTGRPLGAIRRLSAQFNWPGRVAAFEARLADATQAALAAGLRSAGTASQADHERLQQAEFQLAQKVLHASRRWLQLAVDPRRRNVSLGQVCRLINLATRLGRLSAGMPTGDEPRRRPRPEDRPGYWTGPSVEEALEKIYGPEPPGTAVPGGAVAGTAPPCLQGNLSHEMCDSAPGPGVPPVGSGVPPDAGGAMVQSPHRRRDAWQTWARQQSAAKPA